MTQAEMDQANFLKEWMERPMAVVRIFRSPPGGFDTISTGVKVSQDIRDLSKEKAPPGR